MCVSSEAGNLGFTEAAFGLKILNDSAVIESTIFSPLSILLSLSLVHLGAKGTTQNQIRDAITRGASHDQFIEHFTFINKLIDNDINDVQTNIANRLFVERDQPIDQTYLSNIGKHYNAYAEKIDFSQKKEAADIINSFVNESTKGHIQKMVKAENLNNIDAMIINAIHFEADWRYKFDKDSAKDGDFFISPYQKKTVKYLRESLQERKFSSDEIFDVLILPYKDKSANFVIIKPKKRFGLKDALKRLDAQRFHKLIQNSYPEYVNLAFPKFKIDRQFNLNVLLSKFGIKDLFTENADLSGISPGLHISSASHEAMIEVDEWGTRAAAATEVKLYALSGPDGPPIEFKADHPFLYAVIKDCTPIFMGIYA